MVGRCLLGLALFATAPAWAGSGYDYNHAGVSWHTLETEHFQIHWPESRKPVDDEHWFTTEFTAAQLARIAEESYGPITGQFDYDLEEKVHIVVYDQDMGWEGNGFAIAEWDWTGFAANWGPTFRQRGRMEFLSDVFVHEFAHIVSLKAYLPWSEATTGFQLGGLSEDEEWFRRLGRTAEPGVNIDVGFDLVATAHTPFWWAEGGAEYWSHQAGYNFWGSSRDALLRMSVAEDRVLSPVEWTTRVDKGGFDGERGYNHGYAFSLWLHEALGTEAATDMARISAERWHWSWDQVVEEATGRSLDSLYEDWRAHLAAHYGTQLDEIESRGLVSGREIALTEPPWERADEDWFSLSKKAQDAIMDGDTAYQEMPSVSPDGNYVAWFDSGLTVGRITPEQLGAIGGTYVDETDRRALRAWDKRFTKAYHLEYYRVDFSPDSTRLVGTGHEDMAAEGLMNVGLTFNADGYNWTELVVGTIDASGKQLKIDWEPVPNTLRAVEAAWHPNGHTLAFGRYGDGTHELWTIEDDGTEAQQLTDFGDGTQVQGIDWSADGSTLLVSLFRNYQQDLWLLEVETGSWTRLTDSEADETDPTFGPDGKVWFTSDTDGIFNVYSLDLEPKTVTRHTNLIGAAYGAWVSPKGHLLYTDITGHGFRVKGLNAADLLQEEVDYEGLCGASLTCEDAATAIAARPDVPDSLALSRRYNPFTASLPLSLWPVLRTTDKSVEAGTGFFLGDYLEKHYLEGEVTFGKDNYLYLSYWNEMFWPSLSVGYMRYSYKGTYGYGNDLDGLSETDDLSVVDVKFEQASDDLWAAASYWPSDTLWIGASVDYSRYSFRDTGDGNQFVPYVVSSGISAYAEWSPAGLSYYGDEWINPRGGRRLYVDYSYRWTTLLDPEIAGAVYDDGERMERYPFHRLMASYTEFIPVPFTERHTLQLDVEVGYIDRNVMGWDEFVAGGKHPYHWGSGTIGNNVQFSGYEGWSLAGETMIIANAAYRFPIARDLNWKVGPTYTESMYFQLFGSVGNLWSYRVEGPSHLEGYSVVPDGDGQVVRETPFVDYSSKNSPVDQSHYLLADLGAELRVRAFIWNDYDWDSFIRVAYGLQSTAGYGDVNADLIQSSVARDAATELSGEVEPPTLRIYAGIGTGW